MATTAGTTTNRGYPYPGDASTTNVPGDIKAALVAIDTDVAALNAAGNVSTTDLAASAVTTAKIADGAVTGVKIAAGAVGTSGLANDAVTGDKIDTGTVVNRNIASDADIAATKLAIFRQTIDDASGTISTTAQIVAQRGTMTAPRTFTLPAASAVAAGWEVVVQDESGTVNTTNTLTVARAGSDTINGATSTVIGVAYGWRRFTSNGTNKWTFDGGVLRSSQNLSDVASTSTALANLGGVAQTTVGNLLTSAAAACTAGWSGSATVTYAGGKASMVAPSAAAVAPYAISTSTITPGLPYTATLTVDAASQRDVSVAIWFRAGTTLLGTLTAGNAIPAGTGGVSQIAAVAPATADNVLVYANSVAGSTSDVITWSAPAVWQGSGGTLPFWGAPVQGTIAEPPIRATAASVTAHRAQPVIRITSACTVIIPPAAANVGVKFTLINDSSGTLTINRTSPDTIAGATSLTLPGKGSIEIISDGGNANTWLVLAGRYSANTAGLATYQWDAATPGWRIAAYDSGVRNVLSGLNTAAGFTTANGMSLERRRDDATITIYGLQRAAFGSGVVYTLPAGFTCAAAVYGRTYSDQAFYISGADVFVNMASVTTEVGLGITFPVIRTLPTSLPGTQSAAPV